MFRPGTYNQNTFIKVSLGAVEGCDHWRRLVKFKTQLKRNAQWIVTSGAIWMPISEGGDRSNEAQEPSIGLAPINSVFFDRCVHGHRERVRVQFQNSMKNISTGKVAAKGKVISHPIKVVGGCSGKKG